MTDTRLRGGLVAMFAHAMQDQGLHVAHWTVLGILFRMSGRSLSNYL